jgi:hypothetical protein
MLTTLRSGDKDTNVVGAQDPCHRGEARVYTAENVVQLREETERLDSEIVTNANVRHEKAAANVVLCGEGSMSSKHVQKKIIGTRRHQSLCIVIGEMKKKIWLVE